MKNEKISDAGSASEERYFGTWKVLTLFATLPLGYMPNIFYSTIFLKKAVFSEKTAKNCFGGAFDNFLGKGGVLHQKLT